MDKEVSKAMEEAAEQPQYGDLGDLHQLNVYQKLAFVRRFMLECVANNAIKKSGVNSRLEFKYFELSDFVPIAEDLFYTVGLVLVPSNLGMGGVWRAEVINCDNPGERDERIAFGGVWSAPEPIKNRQGASVTNETQDIGAAITYFRRYIWAVVLDLVEADQIDAMAGRTPGGAPAEEAGEQAAPAPKPHAAPLSPQARKQVAQKVADENDAPPLLIKALRNALGTALRDTKKSPQAQALAERAKKETDNFEGGKQAMVERLIAAANELARRAREQEQEEGEVS